MIALIVFSCSLIVNGVINGLILAEPSTLALVVEALVDHEPIAEHVLMGQSHHLGQVARQISRRCPLCIGVGLSTWAATTMA